jgi:outer membrane protein, multidrug efflux system
MIKIILLLLIMVIGLLNCSKSVKHPLIVPQRFPSSTKAYKPLPNLPCLAWWQQFHDEELNCLMELGLRNNMDIHIALGNVQQARGELLQVQLGWIPNLQILAGYSTNPALGVPGGFYAIWPNYLLNIMKLYTQEKEAACNLQYSRAVVEGARLAVIGQIASTYFTLMSQREQLRLLQQFNNDLRTLVTLSAQDIKIGLENDIDLAQLQSDERLIAAQIEPVLHNIVYSENALRFLINENPGGVRYKNNFAKLDFSRFRPGSLPATVLNNRPDMKMALYDLNAACADEFVSWSDFFPSLQLGELLGEISQPKKRFVQITDAYVNWEIIASSLGRVVSSKGKYRAKLAKFYKTVKQILSEVDSDYSANRRLSEQFATYKRAEADYRHKYSLQQGLLRIGLISYKELLQSKIYLDDLELKTNQAKLELAMSLVALYQDLAGGYDYRKAQQIPCC